MNGIVAYSKTDISSISYQRFQTGKSLEIQTNNIKECQVDNRLVRIVLENNKILEFLKQFIDIRLATNS